MLIDDLDTHKLSACLVSRQEFHPFPTIDERDGWENIPNEMKLSMVSEAEKYLDFQWPELTADMFMEFNRSGNVIRYEVPYHQRRRALTTLVIAECIEDRGRFITDIVNGIWCICEESTWVVPSHHHMSLKTESKLPDTTPHFIDLFAAETGNMFGWLYYLIKPRLDEVDPNLAKRILQEVETRILRPYLEFDDFWWMAFDPNEKINNWTPWCTSNCLSAFLFLEDNQENRIAAVTKALTSLSRFIDTYGEEGGCDEGPGYWNKAGGSLFDCLELLYLASDGKLDYFQESKIKNIAAYIYKVHVHDDYYLNFADCPPRLNVEGDLLYRFGKRLGDTNLMGLGSSVHKHWGAKGVHRMKFFSFLRVIPALFNYETFSSDLQQNRVVQDVWLEDIQIMAAREDSQSDKGLYVAMKGNHNDESHNHNDVGNIIVYCDGKPIFIDVGAGTYTKKTFSSERYDIWTMQSSYHNLPEINGSMQQAGPSFKAEQVTYHNSGLVSGVEMDIADAYPKESNINHWIRCCQLHRSCQSTIQLNDYFQFGEQPEAISWYFMTSVQPQVLSDKQIIIQYQGNDAVELNFSKLSVKLSYQTIHMDDEQLKERWGDYLYRIVVTPEMLKQRGELMVNIRKADKLT